LEFDALKDFGQLIFALQSLPRFRSGIDFADRAPFVRTVRCRTVANTLSIGFDVRVLGWEVKEGEQRRFAILRQAGDRLLSAACCRAGRWRLPG
jgi:hypothetical protein